MITPIRVAHCSLVGPEDEPLFAIGNSLLRAWILTHQYIRLPNAFLQGKGGRAQQRIFAIASISRQRGLTTGS
jgi:hypothetical protein